MIVIHQAAFRVLIFPDRWQKAPLIHCQGSTRYPSKACAFQFTSMDNILTRSDMLCKNLVHYRVLTPCHWGRNSINGPLPNNSPRYWRELPPEP